MLRPIPIEINKNTIGQTKPVAAKLVSPMPLTQNESTKLYNVCIKLFKIIGVASVIIAFLISPCSINCFLSSKSKAILSPISLVNILALPNQVMNINI